MLNRSGVGRRAVLSGNKYDRHLNKAGAVAVTAAKLAGQFIHCQRLVRCYV
jgi:hypothetical protein